MWLNRAFPVVEPSEKMVMLPWGFSVGMKARSDDSYRLSSVAAKSLHSK